ncbi:hypothetical protein [Anaerocolumna xylanovorans]|uniref:Uncharacterized protein n=1 Tax=Anaerocolumna xylanovorans DSM 12503 TaxID=1121345 RepID=A0A1M7XWV3_9FIRM|nr:hypothetical protein [Anaerocolumna xylanovorans]SHO43142.1 hypothetical protein SAMN02745217_00107 [Anaerocolumna xylanovorans DSM 12503]
MRERQVLNIGLCPNNMNEIHQLLDNIFNGYIKQSSNEQDNIFNILFKKNDHFVCIIGEMHEDIVTLLFYGNIDLHEIEKKIKSLNIDYFRTVFSKQTLS